MFDLVPFAGSRRVVAYRDRHAGLIAQFLEMHFPGPLPTAVPAAAVGADQQPLGLAVMPPAVHPPPPPDALDGELRGFMGHSHLTTARLRAISTRHREWL